ncbi:MAG: leucyl/phenylalanyl-tRNA--protein transferase [Pseudanabaena sp. ELA607]
MDRFSVAEIIDGYAQGYFLMAEDGCDVVEWYYSRCRTLIPLDQRFRYPKSLQRVLNQDRFTVRLDTAFTAVVDGCANRETTWISPELKQIYQQLHEAGFAHSFETWQGNQLAGGILGLTIQGVFIGESMFFAIPDGSKVAMVKLVAHLRQQGYSLFDAQMMNPHLARFGAFEVGDEVYQDLLRQGLQKKCHWLP